MTNSRQRIEGLGAFGVVTKLGGSFYIVRCNEAMPDAELTRRTPEEVFRGEAADLVERLREGYRVAISERMAANRRLECGDCVVPLRRSLSGDESATILPKQE